MTCFEQRKTSIKSTGGRKLNIDVLSNDILQKAKE